MSCSIYSILDSIPLGDQLTTVSTGNTVLTDAIWAGFFEGNAKFVNAAGLAVYIPLSKIRFIKR
ncbi:hypothetical protein M3194_03280 [Paenibacillus glycanilyticus]|uniref:hypothetical protein n=1 Tax=Paenibacillus glycanilyticus TaxID=126569 RepID=UPI002040700D|nr:hypothetical protein [Paenibacillus glycanilyticus]MCM3626392.1 hypothetical protein [Paenibacillus glycanilyticus]